MFLHLNISPHSNMTSFFRFVDKRAICRWYLIRTCAGEYDWLFHWQHKLCATFSANVNNLLPIKVYYRICTLRHFIPPHFIVTPVAGGTNPLKSKHSSRWALVLRLKISKTLFGPVNFSVSSIWFEPANSNFHLEN